MPFVPQVTNQGGPGVSSFTTAEGKAPAAGQLMRNPDLAATFRRLAEHGASKGGRCRRLCSRPSKLLRMLVDAWPAWPSAWFTTMVPLPRRLALQGSTAARWRTRSWRRCSQGAA